MDKKEAMTISEVFQKVVNYLGKSRKMEKMIEDEFEILNDFMVEVEEIMES